MTTWHRPLLIWTPRKDELANPEGIKCTESSAGPKKLDSDDMRNSSLPRGTPIWVCASELLLVGVPR